MTTLSNISFVFLSRFSFRSNFYKKKRLPFIRKNVTRQLEETLSFQPEKHGTRNNNRRAIKRIFRILAKISTNVSFADNLVLENTLRRKIREFPRNRVVFSSANFGGRGRRGRRRSIHSRQKVQNAILFLQQLPRNEVWSSCKLRFEWLMTGIVQKFKRC